MSNSFSCFFHPIVYLPSLHLPTVFSQRRPHIWYLMLKIHGELTWFKQTDGTFPCFYIWSMGGTRGRIRMRLFKNGMVKVRNWIMSMSSHDINEKASKWRVCVCGRISLLLWPKLVFLSSKKIIKTGNTIRIIWICFFTLKCTFHNQCKISSTCVIASSV